MGASSFLSKCIIITINLFIWTGAALMITSGVMYLTHGDGVNSDVNSKPAYVAIAIGCLLFLVGLAGMCGACSENKVLLGMFLIVAIGSLALMVYSAVVLFTGKDDALDQTEKYVVEQFNNYKDNSSVSVVAAFSNGTTSPSTPTTTPATTTLATTTPATTPAPTTNSVDFIDTIQSSLQCCGWTNYTDWNNYENWNKTNLDYVPASCCDVDAANAHNESCSSRINMKHSNIIYSKGCKDDINIVVKFVFNFMAGAAVVFAVLVFFALCGTLYLIKRRRRGEGFDYSSIVA